MSFDLYLLRPRPGESIDTAAARSLRDAEDGDDPATPDPAAEKLKREAVALIRAAAPNMAPFQFGYAEIAKSMGCTEEEARRRYRHIELNEEPKPIFGVQVTINDDHATITIPYWHRGEKAHAAFAFIRRICDPLIARAGYVLFDPQSDSAVTLPQGWDDLIEQYEEVVGTVQGSIGGRGKSERRWWEFWKKSQ